MRMLRMSLNRSIHAAEFNRLIAGSLGSRGSGIPISIELVSIGETAPNDSRQTNAVLPGAWRSKSYSSRWHRMSNQYSLELRPVPPGAGTGQSASEVELIALPQGSGEILKARFRGFELLLDLICSLEGTKPFQRKALHRTLSAGLVAHVINRETGAPQWFSQNEIAVFHLAPEESGLTDRCGSPPTVRTPL